MNGMADFMQAAMPGAFSGTASSASAGPSASKNEVLLPGAVVFPTLIQAAQLQSRPIRPGGLRCAWYGK